MSTLHIQTELASLRKRIDLVDRRILRLLAKRQRVSAAIAKIKHTRNRPVTDRTRERSVHSAVHREAARLGINTVVTDKIFAIIIAESKRIQENI